MSSEIEESVDAEAIGGSAVGPDDEPAEPHRSLAIIMGSPHDLFKIVR
jgi:hypothetical protein